MESLWVGLFHKSEAVFLMGKILSCEKMGRFMSALEGEWQEWRSSVVVNVCFQSLVTLFPHSPIAFGLIWPLRQYMVPVREVWDLLVQTLHGHNHSIFLLEKNLFFFILGKIRPTFVPAPHPSQLSSLDGDFQGCVPHNWPQVPFPAFQVMAKYHRHSSLRLGYVWHDSDVWNETGNSFLHAMKFLILCALFSPLIIAK